MEDWEDLAVDSVVRGHHVINLFGPHFWEKYCEQERRREMKDMLLPFSKTVALSLAMSLAASPKHSTSF